MKKLSTAIAAIALFGTPALAADMAVKGPPAAPGPAPISWTGWYGGFNFGGTWSDPSINTSATTLQFTPEPTAANGLASATASAQGTTGEFSGHNSGFIGGGQIGYNWQFTNWVAGLEADIQGTSAKASDGINGVTTLFNPTLASALCVTDGCAISTSMTTSKEVDWLGTVRGRLGYLWTPTLLVYGTGGLAYGEVKASTSIFQSQVVPLGGVTTNFGTSSSISQTRTGWTAGGGVEWMLDPHWSAKFEYLYYDLGSVTYNGLLVDGCTGCGGPYFTNNVQTSTRFNGNIARVGLNYQFH